MHTYKYVFFQDLYQDVWSALTNAHQHTLQLLSIILDRITVIFIQKKA